MYFDDLITYRLASILCFHRNGFRDHQEASARTFVYDFPSTVPIEIVSGTNKPPNTTAPALKTCMAGSLGEVNLPISWGKQAALTWFKKNKKLEQYKNSYRKVLRRIIFRICSCISTRFNGKFWCSVKDSELSRAFPFSLSHPRWLLMTFTNSIHLWEFSPVEYDIYNKCLCG